MFIKVRLEKNQWLILETNGSVEYSVLNELPPNLKYRVASGIKDKENNYLFINYKKIDGAEAHELIGFENYRGAVFILNDKGQTIERL